MKKIKIIINTETLAINKLHQITSDFCVCFDGIFFPCECWNDLCASVLAMWLTSVNNYLLGYEDSTTLFFMDGDYSIQFVRQSDKESKVFFWEASKRCTGGNIVDVQYFCRQLLATSSKIINHVPMCKAEQSILELSRLSANLRATLHSIREE